VKSIRPINPRSASVPRDRRVLAIVGDTQVGLWVVRSLGRAGLAAFSVCASPHGLAARSRYSSGAWALESAPDSPAFVDEVLDLARRLDVGSVMTIAEEFHLALIRARGRFEPAIHVFSPSAESFARATDKDAMHALCLELGVPVARGTTLDRLVADPARCGLRFPLVLRTRKQGVLGAAAPWKAAYAADEGELEALVGSVRSVAGNVLVQEHHPGAEDHVQVLMHDGRPVMVGDYIGEHHMPLAGGVTVRRVSCRHEPLIADAVRLLVALGWEGIAGIQFHYDTATDRYIFMEINPRFIGGLPTVIMAGFDAPYMLWQSRFEPERMRPGPYRLGLRTRILGGDANWMLSMIRGEPLPPGGRRAGKAAAVASFLWHAGPWTRDDTFSWRDPVPSLADWRGMLGRALGRARRPAARPPVPQVVAYQRLKRAAYRVSKCLGLFALARLCTRRGLRILCYHSMVLADEDRFRPVTFMRPDTFRRRMELLARRGYPVLTLDDALARLDRGALPDGAAVVTFDEGAYSSYRLAVPILARLNIPVTFYISTYNCVKQTPVFRMVVQYMFWKTGRAAADLAGLAPNLPPSVSLADEAAARRATWQIIRHGEEECSDEDRGRLAGDLGRRLGVDYASIVEARSFNLIGPCEIRRLADAGVDIQLHTHRHRFPADEALSTREILDNKAVLTPLVRNPLRHFCYPSGVWSEAQLPWLSRLGIASAATADVGLNYADTPRLLLRRFVDGQNIAPIEFEAEMCGFAEILRRLRAVLRGRRRT